MQKPKAGDQLSFTDGNGDFTSIMALVGKDAKVLGSQGLQYVSLSSLQLHQTSGGVAYWIPKANTPECKDGRELQKWRVNLSWYGQPFHYTVHGKSERAAVAAACALLSETAQRKPALVTNTVWNNGWYQATPLVEEKVV
jgi:hypothetical protein